MSRIDWNTVKYFKSRHFVDDTNRAEPELIYSLDEARTILNVRIFPSTVPGALARFDKDAKTSQHYAVGRKSKAADVFCEGVPIANFYTLLSLNLFNGIGIYLDTSGVDGKLWVMFHH